MVQVKIHTTDNGNLVADNSDSNASVGEHGGNSRGFAKSENGDKKRRRPQRAY